MTPGTPPKSQAPLRKETLDLLHAALEAVGRDLSLRVEKLSQKSSAGSLRPREQAEYGEIVRLNDTLTLVKLQVDDLSAIRATGPTPSRDQ